MTESDLRALLSARADGDRDAQLRTALRSLGCRVDRESSSSRDWPSGSRESDAERPSLSQWIEAEGLCDVSGRLTDIADSVHDLLEMTEDDLQLVCPAQEHQHRRLRLSLLNLGCRHLESPA